MSLSECEGVLVSFIACKGMLVRANVLVLLSTHLKRFCGLLSAEFAVES